MREWSGVGGGLMNGWDGGGGGVFIGLATTHIVCFGVIDIQCGSCLVFHVGASHCCGAPPVNVSAL